MYFQLRFEATGGRELLNRRFKASLSITCTLSVYKFSSCDKGDGYLSIYARTYRYVIKLIFLFVIVSGLINYMKFDASGKYLFVCGDRAVRVLHNVCGYFTTIASCIRLQGSKQTSATVERQKKTIQECKEALAKFGKWPHLLFVLYVKTPCRNCI